MRRVSRTLAAPSAAMPPSAMPTRFCVVQVRHTLQQAGATGAYSAARFVTGASRIEMRCSIVRQRSVTTALLTVTPPTVTEIR